MTHPDVYSGETAITKLEACKANQSKLKRFQPDKLTGNPGEN